MPSIPNLDLGLPAEQVVAVASRPISSAALWAIRKVRERGFANRLTKHAAKAAGVELPSRLRKTINRWIRETLAEPLCDVSPARAAALLAELAESEGADLAPLGEIEEFITALADRLLAELPPNLREQSLQRTVRDGFNRIAQRAAPADLSDMPPSVVQLLLSRPDSDRAAIDALAALLRVDGIADADAASRIVGSAAATSSWGWWQWAALGLFAQSHGHRADAATAFEQAVAHAAPKPDIWRARAAMARTGVLSDIDVSGIEDAELRRLLGAFADLTTLDPTQLPPMPDPGNDIGVELIRDLHVAAYLITEQYDEAIAIAADTLGGNPESVGALVRLAQAHLAAAKAGRPERVQHLEEARKLATEIRTIARQRHLPTGAEAVAIMCQASMMLEDWAAVLRYGAPPPDGEAIEAEGGAADTITAVIYAALIQDRPDMVERTLPKLPGSHAPSLIRAQLAARAGDQEAAFAFIRMAWREVTDWGRAVSVLLAWARELDDPLPDLASKGIDAEQAARHQEMAEILRTSRTSSTAAAARMRTFVDDNAHLGMTLIDMLGTLGDPAAAVAAAEQIVSVHDDPEVHEYLAVAAFRAEPSDLDNAAHHAAAFVTGATSSSLERRARRLLAAILEARGDRPVEYRRELRWLANNGDIDATWAYISQLMGSGETAAAEQLVDRSRATPRNQPEVLLYLRVLIANGRHDEAAYAAAAAIDEYEDDDEFCAAVLAFVHATGAPRVKDPGAAAALRTATGAFLERSPDHPMFRSVAGDPDQLAQLLRDQLANRRYVLTLGRWLVRNGRLPLGMLADSIGVDYIAVSVGREMISRGHHPDPTSHRAEVEIAIAALDSDVIVDTTAIATGVAAHLWPTVRNSFRTVAATEPSIADALRAAELGPFEFRSMVHADTEGNLSHHERSDQDQQQRTQLLQHIAEAFRKCRAMPFTGTAILPADMSGPRADPFLSAIELAHSARRTLLCDDYSTRVMAEAHGVGAFGLHALVDALEETGRLNTEAAEAHRLELLAQGSCGLPITPARAAAAASNTADVATACRLLANAAMWIQPADGALELTNTLLEHLALQGSDDEAQAVLAHALVGLIERALLTGQNPVALSAALTAARIADSPGISGSLPAALVAALDWTLSEWLTHSGAAVAVVADTLYTLTVDAVFEPREAIAYTMSLLSQLDNQARHVAAEVLLGATPVPAVSDLAITAHRLLTSA